MYGHVARPPGLIWRKNLVAAKGWGGYSKPSGRASPQIRAWVVKSKGCGVFSRGPVAER